jgi:nucleoside-diphosphate-sugar epimerase
VSWERAKVLVTGASGFLGSHVADRLVELGATTYGLARRPSSRNDRIHWLEGDVCDPAAVQRVLRQARPDVVFHLAGQTDAAPRQDLVMPLLRNNLLGSVVLMQELLEIGCRRVVMTASLEEPKEASPASVPSSPYGASKWAEGGYARMYHKLFGLPVVLVRPYMTYGPRQRPGKLIPSLTLALLRGGSPTVTQPDRSVDWIYVGDVVDGILAAALAERVEGRTFDLGSGELLPIREVAHLLEALIGDGASVQLAKPSSSVGEHGRRADVRDASDSLGWRATTPLQSGLERTVAWYRSRLDDYAAAS